MMTHAEYEELARKSNVRLKIHEIGDLCCWAFSLDTSAYEHMGIVSRITQTRNGPSFLLHAPALGLDVTVYSETKLMQFKMNLLKHLEHLQKKLDERLGE